jgi:hypothetical protein
MKKSCILLLILLLSLSQTEAYSFQEEKAKKPQTHKEKKEAREAKKKAAKEAEANVSEVTAHLKKLLKELKNATKKSDIKNGVTEIWEKGLTHPDATVFMLCYEGIRDLKNDKVNLALAALVKKGKKVTAYQLGAGLDLLRYSKNPKVWEACLPHIKSKHRGVGTVAVEVAGQGLRKAVPEIMRHLKRIDMRRRTISLAVLNHLLGESFPMDPVYFENVWLTLKKKFDTKPMVRKTDAPTEFHGVRRLSGASYHGQKLDLANTIFSIDASNSMKPDDPAVKPKPDKKKRYKTSSDEKHITFPPLPKGNGSKIWEARRELAMAIKGLNRHMQFGVFTFGGRVDAYNKGILQKAENKQNLVDAYEWVLYNTPLTRGTWLYQSVGVALRNKDTEVIYLLTDGAPIKFACEKGPDTVLTGRDDELSNKLYYDSKYIVLEAQREYITRRLIINTLQFGGKAGKSKGGVILSDLAKVTHGTFKAVKINKKNRAEDKKAKKEKKAKTEKEAAMNLPS